jgi:hypothetical protein
MRSLFSYGSLLSPWLSLAFLISPVAADELSSGAKKGIIVSAVVAFCFLFAFTLAFLLIRSRRRRRVRAGVVAAKVIEPNDSLAVSPQSRYPYAGSSFTHSSRNSEYGSSKSPSAMHSPDAYNQMQMQSMMYQQPPAYPAPVYEAPSSPTAYINQLDSRMVHGTVHEMPQPGQNILPEMPTEANSPGGFTRYQSTNVAKN